MINKSTSKRLNDLGIIQTFYYNTAYKKAYNEQDISIEELLEKLPALYNNERLSMFKDTTCYEVGYPYQDIRIWHKNLAEALARLLIKLHK